MDLPALYVASTESLLSALAISHQLGHLAGGLILYAGALALIGTRRPSVLPLLLVMAAEIFNEAVQARFYGSWRMADTLGDALWTIMLPLLLFVHAIWLHRRRERVAAPLFVRRSYTL